MSKNKSNKSEVNTASEKPAEVTETVAESLAQAPVESASAAQPEAPTATELATVASSELAASGEEIVDDGVTLAHLVKLLPHKAKTFKHLHVPSEEDYDAARDALSPKAQTAFDDLIERMSAESASETRTRSFRPLTIKLKQGTSNDENCPELADSGSLYTSDGIVLTAITEAKAKKLGVATGINVVLVASWQGRALFAPRINNKVVPLQEFGDANTNLPYCRSLNRLKGAPTKAVPGIGDCPSCPYRPWKTQGEPNLCHDSVTCIFVLLRKEEDGSFTPFDGLYEMQFTKSAVPCGNKVISLAEKGRNPWDRVLRITAKQENTKDGSIYFVPKVVGVNNEDNGRPVTVTPPESAMLKLLKDQVLVQYYYPNLASVYRREEQVRTGGSGGAASKPRSDMSELERRAAAAAGEAAPSSDMRDANV